MNVLRTTILFVLIGFQSAIASTDAPDPELRAALVKAVNETSSFQDRFDAEVWLTDMARRLSKKVPDPGIRLELLKLIHFEAKKVDLPAELILAVIEVESNFDPWAISVVGARGLMQIMPFWLKEIGRVDDNLFHPPTNLRMGCTILRFYYDKEKGDLARALARYNGSLGRTTYSDKVFRSLRLRWYRQ